MDTAETATPEEPSAAPAPRTETRYPLAFDANGNPLLVPSGAVAWGVRRCGGHWG
jgi:hypothetical protein